jgi:peptide/nickel transport system permease protein
MSTQRGRIRVEGFDADAVRDRESVSGWQPSLQSARGKGRLHYAWRRFRRNRLALAGATLIALMVLAAVFARPLALPTQLSLPVGTVDIPVVGGTTVQPLALAPSDPASQDLLAARAPPSAEHPFGTDWAGRDIFSRVIYGGRWSLSIGFIAVGLALVIGVPLGSISGYYGGLVDETIMRVVDTLYAFPFIVLAIAFIAILGRGYWEMILALVLVGWLPYARIIRGEILSVKENEYVLAAKALGARDRTVIARHIVPNAMAPVIVQATLSVGSIVLAAAALGFLGLGLSPGSAEWGTMLQVGRDSLVRGEWWITFFPGFAIFLFVMAINLVGDGVRDAFDPQSEGDVGQGELR